MSVKQVKHTGMVRMRVGLHPGCDHTQMPSCMPIEGIVTHGKLLSPIQNEFTAQYLYVLFWHK